MVNGVRTSFEGRFTKKLSVYELHNNWKSLERGLNILF